MSFLDEYIYSPEWDAHYHKETYEWWESPCTNPDCEICNSRPEKAPYEPQETQTT